MGAASGRIDALVFMAGLVAGAWVFAEAYVLLAGFVSSSDLGAVTLTDQIGVPLWGLALGLVVVALATFWLVETFERRMGGR